MSLSTSTERTSRSTVGCRSTTIHLCALNGRDTAIDLRRLAKANPTRPGSRSCAPGHPNQTRPRTLGFSIRLTHFVDATTVTNARDMSVSQDVDGKPSTANDQQNHPIANDDRSSLASQNRLHSLVNFVTSRTGLNESNAYEAQGNV